MAFKENVSVAKGACTGFRTMVQSTLYEAAGTCLRSDQSAAFSDAVACILRACNEREELANGWRYILQHSTLKIKLLPVFCAAWHMMNERISVRLAFLRLCLRCA
jgi:hypothetical protein